MIYFDNSATTAIYPEALESYVQASKRFMGNPSSLHQLGVEAHQLLSNARKQVAELLGADSSEVYFTSGGTESNNWAIKGTAFEKKPFGNHILVSSIEHPSVLQTVKQLETLGFDVETINVNKQGVVDVSDLKRKLRPDTILVSVMAVNNEVGSIQPIEEISRVLVDFPWVHFHVDAVQGVHLTRTIVQNERVDLVSLSAHKFHGPRGVGILYKKHGRTLQSLLAGGGQEQNERSSTENVPGIVATAKALRMTLQAGDKEEQLLRERVWEYLEKEENIRLFSTTDGASHIICFALKGVRGEVLVHALEEKGIYMSTTSACSSKKGTNSGTLLAMQVPTEWATSAVRISFSHTNTLAEVDEFIQVMTALKQKFSLFY